MPLVLHKDWNTYVRNKVDLLKKNWLEWDDLFIISEPTNGILRIWKLFAIHTNKGAVHLLTWI